MFDVGFSELLVIGIVALIVIGPERLPAVARTLGHLMGRAQRYINDVKAGINREVQLEELKKLQAQVVDSAQQLEGSFRQEMLAAQKVVQDVAALSESVEMPTEIPAASEIVVVPDKQPTKIEAAPATEKHHD